MKRGEFTFSPLVAGILALLLIVVCIAVFYFLTKGPLQGFLNINQGVKDDSSSSSDSITINIGTCEQGDEKCLAGQWYTCNKFNRWEGTGSEC
jgi:hypothetical protein